MGVHSGGVRVLLSTPNKTDKPWSVAPDIQAWHLARNRHPSGRFNPVLFSSFAQPERKRPKHSTDLNIKLYIIYSIILFLINQIKNLYNWYLIMLLRKIWIIHRLKKSINFSMLNVQTNHHIRVLLHFINSKHFYRISYVKGGSFRALEGVGHPYLLPHCLLLVRSVLRADFKASRN